MRDFFVNFFKDDTFGPNIELFNYVHFIYLLIVFSVTALIIVLFRNKDEEKKKKILDIYSLTLVILYFGDFLVYPLMNDENYLIVDKLPFHLCTSACILIALTRLFKNKLKWLYDIPPILGLVGAIMYIMVPTGVAGNKIFCYRTIQTLIYHGMLFSYGVFSIAFKDVVVDFKNLYKFALVIVIQIIISLIANAVYSIPDYRDDAHSYNWYFTKGGLFGLPISDFLMPFIIFVVFMTMVCIIYGITYLIKYINNKKCNN